MESDEERTDAHVGWTPIGAFVRQILERISVARLERIAGECEQHPVGPVVTKAPEVGGALGDELEEKPRTNPGKAAAPGGNGLEGRGVGE